MSLRQLDMNDTRLIKLEQFSTEPRQELAAVFKWLGLRFEEGVLDYHKQPISWNLINSGNKSRIPSTTSSVIGRSTLNLRQRGLIGREASKQISQRLV